jgi:hypothetical protein
MQDHEQKKEEVKNQDSMGKTKFFLSALPFSPWAILATWLHVNTRKMSLIHVFNKISPWAHTELELDVLDIHGKFVKYIVHSSKRKN